MTTRKIEVHNLHLGDRLANAAHSEVTGLVYGESSDRVAVLTADGKHLNFRSTENVGIVVTSDC
jgi:hypothetical protein